MDKQKQIEEMENIIKENLYEGKLANEFAKKLAIRLAERFQPKIPEGAVVHIDRKLFNEIVNDILLSVKPVYLRKEIASKMLDLTNRLIVDTHKETAEKFAEMARAKARWMRDHHGDYTAVDIDDIDEICKDFTGGNKCQERATQDEQFQ